MARAVIFNSAQRAAYGPLYDIDRQTGHSIEVFYADRVLTQSFGTNGPGCFWWTCQGGCLSDGLLRGPFADSYLAYRDFATRWMAN